jgi:hypothetical protein
MMWEYLMVSWKTNEELNAIGEDGWELVAMETRRERHSTDPGYDVWHCRHVQAPEA